MMCQEGFFFFSLRQRQEVERSERRIILQAHRTLRNRGRKRAQEAELGGGEGD